MIQECTKDVPRPLDAASLCKAIRAQTDEWIREGRVRSAGDVGNGHCYDFAEGVMTRLGVEGHGSGFLPEDSRGRLIDCVTEDWWSRVLLADGSDSGEAECFRIDLPRLRREGAPLPDRISHDDEEFACLLGSMTHNWLVLDDRHHDASCPEGAEHFLLMPFFKNQVDAHLNDRILDA